MSAEFHDFTLKAPSLEAFLKDLAPCGCIAQDDAGKDVLQSTPTVVVSFCADVVDPPDQVDESGNVTKAGTHLGPYAWIRFTTAPPAEFVVGHKFANGTEVVAPSDPGYRTWA